MRKSKCCFPVTHLSIIFSALLLVSCGGGSGSSNSGEVTTEQVADEAPTQVSEETTEQGTEETISQSTEETGSEVGLPVETDAGNPVEINDGETVSIPDVVDDSPIDNQIDNGSTDDLASEPPTESNPEPPVNASAGSADDLRALAVVDEDAPGLDGQRLFTINRIDAHRSGNIVFEGGYATDIVNSITNGVFARSSAGMELVLSEDSVIDGVPVGFEFFIAEGGINIASDGTVATSVTLLSSPPPGSSNRSEMLDALVQINGDQQPVAIVRSGDELDGTDGLRSVGDITLLDHSPAGSLFTTETALFGRRVLFLANTDGTEVIAEQRNVSEGAAPTIGGCNVFLPSNSPFTPVVLNTGEVVFEADIDVGDSSEDCVGGGRAIVERGASGFRSIVSEGDPVPSVENWFFEEPRLLDVLENGDALVFAELLRPAPVFSERLDLASWWVFPRNGAPRLVHLEGEQVTRSDGELVTEFGGISNGEITGLFQPTVQVSTSGHALLRLEELLAANSRNTFHVGRIPDGQPHGSLEAPGASSLLPVAETYLDAELPGSSLESIAGPDTRLGTVDDPVMGSDGQVYFVASIIDTNPLSSVGRWVLRINSDGEIESHVGPTDRVDVAGIDQLALSGVLGASRGINIFPFDDGSLLLSARLAGNFLDALVFVESNRN